MPVMAPALIALPLDEVLVVLGALARLDLDETEQLAAVTLAELVEGAARD